LYSSSRANLLDSVDMKIPGGIFYTGKFFYIALDPILL